MKHICYAKYKVFVFLFLVVFLIYFVSSRGEGAHWNYFVLLADAFLNGRLYLEQGLPWLNELLNINGRYYVVYPPMPAVILMPFVGIFGIDFYQPMLSILFGAVNVGLAGLIFLKIFKEIKLAYLGGILYGFGTMHWFHSEVGSVWYVAHIISNFFIWMLIAEVLGRKRLFIMGIWIGCAYLSRLPAVLSIVFVLLFFRNELFLGNIRKVHFKRVLFLLLGVLPFVLANFAYNYFRYGVIYDLGYSLLPVFEEPWYKDGLFNLKNVPIHLFEIIFALPTISNTFPYLIPSIHVLALWFVTPAFLAIVKADFRKPIIYSSLVTVLIMSLPGLMHGSNGFTQFGFRFAIDYLPFLMILTLSGLKNINYFVMYLLIGLSIAINLWGVVFISWLNFGNMANLYPMDIVYMIFN